MGIVFRQSIKTTIIIFLGALLGAFILWLSTTYIPKQELGFVRTLTNCTVVATQILSLGFHNSIAVYMHKYAAYKQKRGFLIAICLVIPTLFLCFSTLLYIGLKASIVHLFQVQDIPFIDRYFLWLPVFTVLMLYQVILEQYLISQVKVAISAFVREVVLRVANVVIIVLYGFGFISFDTFIMALVLAYLIPVLLFLWMSVRTESFAFNLNKEALTKAEVKDLAQFTWYHFLLSITISLMGFLDTFMLVGLDKTGLVSVAIYGNAVFFISLLQIPYKAMYTATFPVLAQAIRDEDYPLMKDLFMRSSLNILIGATFMVIVIVGNLNNAVVLMKGYEAVKPLVMILMIGNFVDMATGMNSQVLTISNYYRFNFQMAVVLVGMMLVLNFWLIPIYGIYGAAIATTSALMLFNIAKFLFLWAKMGLQPFSSKTLLILVAGAPAFIAGYYLPPFFDMQRNVFMHVFADAAIRSLIMIIIYALMLLWLKPSADMELYVKRIRETKRLF
jgi:O-antigen/teichoic acid export membrane protein